MENSLTGLKLAAGVIITCIVIGLGFYISNLARDTAHASTGKINKLNTEFAETDKSMYDGLEVSGSSVVNAIKQYSSDNLGVKVVTGKDTTGKWYGFSVSANGDTFSAATGDVTDAQNEKRTNYINPNGKFLGELVRDSNDKIVAIIFKQVSGS